MILIVTLILTFLATTIFYLYNNEWTTFFIDSAITIISTLLSGAILVSVTLEQIERGEEENKITAREKQRINCLPLLSYTIKITHNNTLNIKIKNIGNQAIRKYDVIINEENIIPSTIHNCLAINEETILTYKLSLNNINKNIEPITIDIYYQDIIYNKYQQKINISCHITNNTSVTIDKITVMDEQLIKDNQINK